MQFQYLQETHKQIEIIWQENISKVDSFSSCTQAALLRDVTLLKQFC